MSYINQDIRNAPYDATRTENPEGFNNAILSITPAESTYSGTGAPQPEDGKRGDVFYSDDGTIYLKKQDGWQSVFVLPGSSASGGGLAIQSIANVGTTDYGLFKNKVDSGAFFKNLKAGLNITLSDLGDDILISSTDTGAIINDATISPTEAWSSEKINNEISSIPDQKGILAGSNKLSIIESPTDYTIDAVPSNIDILSLGNAPSSNVVGVFDSQLITNKVYQAQDGAVSAPSHSFTSAPTSGIWHDPLSCSVKVSAGGIEYLSVSAAGVNSPIQIRGQGNGTTAPALSFTNKTNSGLQNQGNDVNLIANGATVAEFKVGEIHAPTNVQFTSDGGSALAPDYALQQTNMGLFRNSNNELGLSVAGQSKLLIDGSNIKPLVPIETNLGSEAAPVLVSSTASDSGLYFNAAGQPAISESGQKKQEWTSTETIHTQKNRYPDGSISSPSVAFGPSGVDGLYWAAGAVNTLYMTFGTGTAFYNENEIGVSANTRFRPGTDGIMNLGNSNRRWNTIFASQGTINTSDERYKKDIKPISLGTEFIKKLEPITFVWKDTINKYDPDILGSKDLEPVIHKRNHCGLIAQKVKKSIEECGLTLNDVDIVDNDYLVDKNETDIYNIRYHALIPVLIKTIQELEARISALENK